MGWILLGAGLVLVIEGLVFALAPSRLEEALEALKQVPPEARRLLGLAAVALGVLLVWLARQAGI
ncbi:DUF2065 domain-containing protein [Ovoidimarina sediminis]|uniref:DUF2065 domain-containing protein n=1 Tax=Ovoidimarina sediminis TaxID=3079856 RepID=UPI0029089347|nr:DUF2065 domain-containing protein [Rhodophyticola sp. MJ-SS7]MDU8942703.1 DUF2065 domain-containing protein [Rhodophyticola sp. MJ-SS7]